MSEERKVWQEPDYEGMIPLLKQAHIEIEQLRFKLQKLQIHDSTEISVNNEIIELTSKEVGAMLGMLIQQGNNRLQELGDVKSYLTAVGEEGMLKVNSGYVFGYTRLDPDTEDELTFKYLWSPSGIKVDSFEMQGFGEAGTDVILERNHEEIEDSMLLSIDFEQLEELFRNGLVPQ